MTPPQLENTIQQEITFSARRYTPCFACSCDLLLLFLKINTTYKMKMTQKIRDGPKHLRWSKNLKKTSTIKTTLKWRRPKNKVPRLTLNFPWCSMSTDSISTSASFPMSWWEEDFLCLKALFTPGCPYL